MTSSGKFSITGEPAIVVGLGNVPQLFAGHMWTEVWLKDRWYPLDATLAEGGIGAGHLKISHSALDENAPAPITSFLPIMQLLGQMTIEVESQK